MTHNHNKLLNNISKNSGTRVFGFWEFFRKIISSPTFKTVAPFLVGGFGVFTCIVEAYKAIKEIYQTFRNPSLGQRKTRMMSSLLIILFAGAGIGLATTLMIAAAGVAISLQAMLAAPLIIPALFTGMYSLVLWRTIYIFHQANQNALRAKKDWRDNSRQKITLGSMAEANKKIVAAKEKYDALHHVRLLAERQMIFRALDVANSTLITTSVFLSSSIFFVGGAASLGVVPAVLLFIGIIMGCLVQGLEYLDKKYNYALTHGLRKGLVSVGEGVKHLFRRAKAKLWGEAELVQPPNSGRRSQPSNVHQKMIEAQIINLNSLEQGVKPQAAPATKEQKIEQALPPQGERNPDIPALSIQNGLR